MTIELRDMLQEDLPFMLEIRNECREMLHDNREFSLSEAQTWFASLPPDHKYYLLLFNNEPIGYFRTKEKQGCITTLEIGADLHKDFRGRGLAFEIYQFFLNSSLAQSYSRLELEVLATNLVAYNLYRKLGFRCYPEAVRDIIRDGRRIPSIAMYKYVKKPK